MKTLLTGILSLLCILACISSFSQQVPPVREPDLNKPLLFEQLPQKLTCRINELQTLLQGTVGQVVNFNAADNLNVRGVISSVTNDNGKLMSVVIRSTNLNGAVLSFSRITPEEGPAYFTGRIISMQHGDCYELTLENGIYVLNKKGFYDMINE